ncbi:MAG: aminotransferase class V-fold PLP-dependent enzyme [Dongiaceae bacterium]
MRSGTLPAPLCIGLGEACAIAGAEMADELARLARLRDRLLVALRAALPDVVLNGAPTPRVAGNLNLGFPGIDGQALLEQLPELSLSLGSACTSAALEPSYVLQALGVPDDLANGSIRIGLGRFTAEAEVDFAVDRLISSVRRLKAGRPAVVRA